MLSFIKQFFSNPQLSKRNKRRYRSHSLVAGDRVKVSKIYSVTQLGSQVGELKLIKREGTVVKSSYGFNHEILFDGDDIPTHCNYTYRIQRY